MVVVVVYQIVVDFFNFFLKFYMLEFIKYVIEWQKLIGWVEFFGYREWQEFFFVLLEMNFLYVFYIDFDFYLNGVVDMVGYWVEDWIFGGVVVFDCGESGIEVCNRILFLMLSLVC